MILNFRFFIFNLLIAGAALAAAPQAEIKAAFHDQAELVEQEIAQRMLQRPETTGDRLAVLDLGIDLRLLERFLWAQGAGAQAGSEMELAWRLRGQVLHDATASLEGALAGQGQKLSPAQAEAASHLHQLTFSMPKVKSIGEMDELSRKIGLELARLFDAGEKPLPLMRPRPVASPMRESRPVAHPPTAAELAGEISRLNVSVALRQQLLLLANSAGQPNQEGLVPTLDTCVDLARGLQYNTGVNPEARVAMEGQLAQGIALFTDPRTREMGRERIAALGKYRALLAKVEKLRLSPEQVAQLAPVFAYVRENPAGGARVMAALEKATQASAHLDARAKGSALPPFARPVGELEKQFSAAYAQFRAAALDLPRGVTSPEDLANKADDLSRIAQTLEHLDRMPADLQLLATFKPHPLGVLDRKAAQAALAAAHPTATPARAEAIHFLADLDRLAQHATELAKISSTDVPAYLEKRWTGGKMGAVEARWKAVVTEQASLLASGNPMDEAKADRLLIAVSLVDALKAATTMDANLAQSEPLEKWIDWRLTIEDWKALLGSYPDAMAQAFGSYLTDDTVGLDQWNKTQQRYAPIVSLINRDAIYRDQCAPWPSGGLALAAQMLTPLNAQPFASERTTAFAAWLVRTQPALADEAFTLIAKQLP